MRLEEQTFQEKALQVDTEAGVISGVKCLGRTSKNGREYSEQALTDAAKLYDGAEVNIDHAQSADRKFGEGFGEIRNPVKTSEGVFGDLHFLTTHPMARMVAEAAQKFPDKLGLSHVAVGNARETESGLMVESLESVDSVDIVKRPATNAGLFESEETEPPEEPMSKAKRKKAREVLEAHKEHELAAPMLVLIEAEEFAAQAEAPVNEMPAEASADEQILAAFEAMIVAAFRDESLDAKATIKKIGDIVKTHAKLIEKGDKPDTSSEGGDDSDKMAEAIAENARLNVLSTSGILLSQLSESQRAAYARADSEEAAKELLEAFQVKPLGQGSPKPPMGARRDDTAMPRTLEEARAAAGYK